MNDEFFLILYFFLIVKNYLGVINRNSVYWNANTTLFFSDFVFWIVILYMSVIAVFKPQRLHKFKSHCELMHVTSVSRRQLSARNATSNMRRLRIGKYSIHFIFCYSYHDEFFFVKTSTACFLPVCFFSNRESLSFPLWCDLSGREKNAVLYLMIYINSDITQ